MHQLTFVDAFAGAGVPELNTYHYIVVSSSAGKDSQCSLDVVVELATAAGARDRVVVVHCDLGRVEWSGTRDLAERQAQHYGVRFEVVSRPQGDLLTEVEQKGKWPGMGQTQYCTSDHKTSQVAKLFTRLAEEHRLVAGPKAHTRILDCQGIRAQESDKRAARTPFTRNERISNTVKTVDTWYPVFDWTTDEVWARIRRSGVEHHQAYDLGMDRLSCVFCIYAGPEKLAIAGRHNRALLDEYCAVEERIGHQFKANLSIRSIRLQLISEAQ